MHSSIVLIIWLPLARSFSAREAVGVHRAVCTTRATTAYSTISAVPAVAAAPLAILKEAAATRSVGDEKVVGALLDLEKAMRGAAKDDPAISLNTLEALDGAWRLVFTTGTVDTQKRIGKISYFPIKAVQSFDTQTMAISNGIFLGNVALLKFFGDFDWDEKKRRLNFDFDAIAILGLRLDLPKGGAAKIGASTGLGSENNVQLTKQEKRPFFNWISADESVATARGGGGGLALWRRVESESA